MDKPKKIVAFIPVRGGSKSIPHKNIKHIAGQPLVYWVIDAAVNCKYIDKVYVSTDSARIKHCVSNYHKSNSYKIECIDRNPQTATDDATTEMAMLEFAENFHFTNIILIQATSPLLTSENLSEAIEKYKLGDFDSLLSVVKQKRFIWDINKNNYTVKPLNYTVNSRPPRQEQSGYLVENGAFYITKKEFLINSKLRLSGKIGSYEMPEETYHEIDEPTDWIIVEGLLLNSIKYRRNGITLDFSNIKLFAMDCDGVLTDAGMYYTEYGDEIKKFNTKDGMGIKLLHENSIQTAIITGENTKIVKSRANKMGIMDVYQGINNKVSVMEELLQKYNLDYSEVAYMGDDINDIELLRKVGYSFSVENATDSVKAIVDYVSRAKGGQGAVREVVELILLKSNYEGRVKDDEF